MIFPGMAIALATGFRIVLTLFSGKTVAPFFGDSGQLEIIGLRKSL